MTLNLLLPGAGQFYLGQPIAGSVYAFGFIACFVTSIVIFLRDYGGYIQMSTGGDIFETGNLERLTQSFHTGWLGGLQVAAIVIYIASTIHLSRSAAR
jgi:TM2 domain-containing membrane protein YozV